MPVYFRHVSQLLNRVDYAKITKAALARKHDEEPFVSFEKFAFADGTEGPLVVFGEVSSSLLADLKKSGKGLAEGVCAREDDGGRLTFRHAKGKPTYKALKDALVGVGVRADVRVEAALREGDVLPSKAMGEEYRGEERGEGWRTGTGTTTAYFGEARKEKNRLELESGKLVRDGKNVSGTIGYVMDPKTGRMHAFGLDGAIQGTVDWKDGRHAYHHHSSPLSGKDVAAAGHITIENGRIVAIDDSSGHYKPNAELTYSAMRQMESEGLLDRDQSLVDVEGKPLSHEDRTSFLDAERYARKIAKYQRRIEEARAELAIETDPDERALFEDDIVEYEEQIEKYERKLEKARAGGAPGPSRSEREALVHLQGKEGLSEAEFAGVKGDLDALQDLVREKFGVELYPKGVDDVRILYSRARINLDIGEATKLTLRTSQFLQTEGNERAIRQKDRVKRFLERIDRPLKPSEVKYVEQLVEQIDLLGGDAELRGRGLDPDAMTVEEQADVLTGAIPRPEALKRWFLETLDDPDTEEKKFLKLGGGRKLVEAGLDPQLVDVVDGIYFLKGKITEEEARLLWSSDAKEPGVHKLDAMGVKIRKMTPRDMVDVLTGVVSKEDALAKWPKKKTT